MNLEILSQVINHNQYHSFEFSQNVNQFFLGFSKVNIKYDNKSHHVNKILIDVNYLNNIRNTITVRPQILMNDISNNYSTPLSSIEVVALASVGKINKNI